MSEISTGNACHQICVLWHDDAAIKAQVDKLLEYDRDKVINRDARALSDALIKMLNGLLVVFFEGFKLSVSSKQYLVLEAGQNHDHCTEVFIYGAEISNDIVEMLRESAVYFGSSVIKQMEMSDIPISIALLDQEKIDFVDKQVTTFRDKQAGKRISGAFSLDFGRNGFNAIPFKGEYDQRVHREVIDTKLHGFAIPDGYRSSSNEVYLLMADADGNVTSNSMTFKVKRKTFFPVILQANLEGKLLKFSAVRSVDPNSKHTAHYLLEIEIIEKFENSLID